MTAPTLDPIVVLDVNDWHPWPPDDFREQVCAWLRRHNVDPKYVHRVEVYLLDAPFARVHQYDTDANGTVKLDPDDPDDVAKLAPFDVLLRELPPEAAA